jgi:hypothetical protein
VRASGFNVKSRLAAEYRMTLYRCDVTNASPSKAFMQWRPEIIHSTIPWASKYDPPYVQPKKDPRSMTHRSIKPETRQTTLRPVVHMYNLPWPWRPITTRRRRSGGVPARTNGWSLSPRSYRFARPTRRGSQKRHKLHGALWSRPWTNRANPPQLQTTSRMA